MERTSSPPHSRQPLATDSPLATAGATASSAAAALHTRRGQHSSGKRLPCGGANCCALAPSTP
eukprot:316185-Lingulodinium_polyedra.AAC.1